MLGEQNHVLTPFISQGEGVDIISKGEIATLRRRENLINSDRATDAKIDIQY